MDNKKLVDFLIEITKNKKLGKDVLDYLQIENDPKKLENWFKEKGYQIEEDECIIIMKHKDDLITRTPQPMSY